MADVNGRKRKRAGEGKSQPKKKAALDPEAAASASLSSTPIRISSVAKAQYCPPVVASSTGLRLESNLSFRPYQKKEKPSAKKSRRRHPSSQGLLLHSNKHRTVDFTAREDVASGEGEGEPTLRHYVGVFDPKTGKLEVVDAKKMVVRGTVRAKQADDEAMIAPADDKSFRDQKANLGNTFGTRKARKALESNAMNALRPDEGAAETNEEGSPRKLDAASKATLSQIGQVTSTMASQEQLQAVVDNSKPVPRADLEASEIADVYDPRVIIGDDVLRAIPVLDWQDAIRTGEDLQLFSRFVARRVYRLGKQEKPTEKLRLLRYLYLLITFYVIAKDGRARGTKRVPRKDQLAANMSPAPQSVIESIRRKFADGSEMRKFHIDLLMTHCCVIAAILDNFETDVQDLYQDLRIDAKTAAQYYHEIGARVKMAKKPGEAAPRVVAKLALPLKFPKMSRGAPKRR